MPSSLRSIKGGAAADKGIEALAYSAATGYFYAGIQGTGEILTLELAEKGVSKIHGTVPRTHLHIYCRYGRRLTMEPTKH